VASDFVYGFPGNFVRGLHGFELCSDEELGFMQLLNDLGLAVRFGGLLESLEEFFVRFVGLRTLL